MTECADGGYKIIIEDMELEVVSSWPCLGQLVPTAAKRMGQKYQTSDLC